MTPVGFISNNFKVQWSKHATIMVKALRASIDSGIFVGFPTQRKRKYTHEHTYTYMHARAHRDQTRFRAVPVKTDHLSRIILFSIKWYRVFYLGETKLCCTTVPVHFKETLSTVLCLNETFFGCYNVAPPIIIVFMETTKNLEIC